MYVVIRTLTSSSRSVLGLSLVAFAIAGSAQGSTGTAVVDVPAVVVTGGALAVALTGVIALAQFARTVSRRRLALAALSLWTAVLLVSGTHAIGLETVASGTPAPGAAGTLLESVTWATVLGAGSTTGFLAFREYGARAETGSPEERVLEGDADV